MPKKEKEIVEKEDDGLLDLPPSPSKEKQMFDSSDLVLDRDQLFRDAELKEIRNQIDVLWQAVHQKGLEAGVPNIIVFQISEIASSLSSMRNLLSSDDTKRIWREKHDEAHKILNRGNEIQGFHQMELHSIELEQAISKLDSYLYDLINRLNRLQSVLIGRDVNILGK